MRTKYCSSKFLFNALFLFTLITITLADTETPARVLAKQTGATQFKEEHIEAHPDCNEHKHHLKKRASDEDVDYEVYQGVVGRPGLDFPIYPRIPRTTFSCKSFGNGYFADMDTDCQVFHICEEGRKISFLCPNGTIFQQSELTCDWWFKVNCLGSPGYYAESAEILQKQRVHRVRPSVPVQGFNIVGGGLNIKPKIASNAQQSRNGNKKPERRIDSNEEPSVETIDFEDISGEKQLKGKNNKVISNIDNNNNDETQLTAETASFVNNDNRRHSYTYEHPNSKVERKSIESKNNVRNNGVGSSSKRGSNGNRDLPKTNDGSYNNESTEKARNGQRGQQRFKEDKRPVGESFERSDSNESKETKKTPEKIIRPITPADVQSKSNSGSAILAEDDVKPEHYAAQSTRTVEKTQYSVTPYFNAGTYTTARRFDTTRSTPFYTPTVPSIIKSKATEGKSFYIKGKGNAGTVASTPNPNRLVSSGTSSSIFLESSAAPARISITTSNVADITSTTFRPIVIGMRQNHDSNSDIHYISLSNKNGFSLASPLENGRVTVEPSERITATTAAPTSTGPTYLPKNSRTPTDTDAAAGADLLLFAPNPVDNDSVTRNVNEMLKAMSSIKGKLEDDDDVVKSSGPPRIGLEIPPSSGPDVLVSLAKYFAGEQNDSTANALNAVDSGKSIKSRTIESLTGVHTSNILPTAKKPSDTTTSITTTDTPAISANADNIRASLLSDKTVDKYSNLFGLKDPKGKQQSGDISEGLLSKVAVTESSKTPDFEVRFPQIGSTDATINQLATKPESRKIAQVFSNALTTYLEDPKSFREQLAAARPTEPPIGGKSNFEPVTVTDSLVFNKGTAASYLPTKPTPAGDSKTTTTTQSSIAAEINNKFDYSTQVPDIFSTTEVFDATTYRTALSINDDALRAELSGELLPPGADSGEEFLQREQTQSFVKSRNNLSNDDDKKSQNADAEKSSSFKPTENPWSHISQTDFLDPLTINDGLMKEAKTTTPSPFTYLPKETTTNPPPTTIRGNFKVLSSDSERLEKPRTHTRVGSAEVTTPHTSAHYHSTEDSDSIWQDIFSTYNIPRDTLPSTSGLQRIANKLFGGLNEKEALHLKNVMQQAEHDRQVLSLLLLLIQTCDDQNGRALERSRKHLLNALIDMDGKKQAGKESYHKDEAATTTTQVPVTAYRRGGDDGAFSTITTKSSYFSTTTELPLTTTIVSTTLAPGSGSVEETTKFEIRVAEPEADFATSTTAVGATNSNTSSDKRALELLKSLYSLASKFTSRR